MKAYRICERKGEKLLTLFHSLNGTRVLPVGTWLEAQIKPVRDGSKKTSKQYISGFHTIADLNECRKFTKKFTAPRDLVIVECEIEGNRRKEHSPANIILADKMKILKIVEKIQLNN